MSLVRIVNLPRSWELIPLKLVTTLLSRGSAPDYVDNGPVHVVNQASNQPSGLDWSRTRFHDYQGNPARLRGHLRSGDVLINSTGTGTLGRVGYFVSSPDGRPCMTDGHVTIARADQGKLNPRFLYYWLSSGMVQGLIVSALTVGATNQIELSRERLSATLIGLPPLEDQRRMAQFLDAGVSRLNDMAAASERQIQLLADQRIERIRLKTTGVCRGGQKKTGVPWLPFTAHDWSVRKLSHVFLTGSGTTPRSSDPSYFGGPYSWINTGDLRDGMIYQVGKSVTDAAFRDYPTLSMHPAGSLIVAMYGATTGRVGITAMPACTNQACCVIRSTGVVDVRYAFYWLIAHRSEIVGLASGGGQPNISQDIVRSLRISLPARTSEQHDIIRSCDEVTDSVEERVSQLKHRLVLLSERREALITAAVTGQIDVSTASRVTV